MRYAVVQFRLMSSRLIYFKQSDDQCIFLFLSQQANITVVDSH